MGGNARLGATARVLALGLALMGLVAFGPSAAQPQSGPPKGALRPNIVLILIDDAGFTDLGAYGSEIRTPAIDGLAREGARFTNFHVSPMCAPTRAMLLTGVDSHTAGVGNLPESTPREHQDKPGYQGRLSGRVDTVASLLKASGYHTFMAGKWHLGDGPDDLPNRKGFDRSFALDATGGDNWEQRPYFPIYQTADWYEDGKPAKLPKDFHSSTYLVDRMIGWIDGRPRDGQPFFAYLPFLAIHMPVQAPDAYVARYEKTYSDGWEAQRRRRYEGAVRAGVIAPGTAMGPSPMSVRAWSSLSEKEQIAAARNMAVNAAMLEAMDHDVGRLIAHLRKTGEYDNTLFVVLSDNGPEAADPPSFAPFRAWMGAVGYRNGADDGGGPGTWRSIGPGWASASAAPFSYFKFYAGEGGVRVPLIMTGQGVPAGATIGGFAYVTDIAPTLLRLGGAQPAADKAPLVGRDLGPMLSDPAARTRGDGEAVVMEAAGNAAVWKGDYKLVRNIAPLGDGTWKLYDLKADPGETRDLASALPARAEAMKEDYAAHAARVGVVEIPAGYSADGKVAADMLGKILGVLAPRLIIGALIVLAIAGLLAWRMARRGERAGMIAMRLLLGAVGVLSLLIASRFWLAPAEAAQAFALQPHGKAGLGSIRADLGAFFGVAGALSLLSAIRRERRWLWPVPLILALALAGRTLNLIAGGPAPGLLAPMIVEAVLIAITLSAWRMLPDRR
jgi:arylsulfatase/uncharacterized sulfatase